MGTTIEEFVHSPLSPGNVLVGRYRLLRKLGRGPISSVYRAEDLKANGEFIAVKVLSHEYTRHRGVLDQLRTQLNDLQALPHSGVVKPIRVFEYRPWRYAIVSELASGVPLSELIFTVGEPLPLARMLRILHGTACILSFAHEQGIVHGNLKPENIFVTDTDEVSLSDFTLGNLPDVYCTITGSGAEKRLTHYMPPDQHRSLSVNTCMDIYALGVIACEMVTRQKAFSKYWRLPWAGLLPLPFPGVNLGRPDIPKWYRAFARVCMAEAPERRFDSMKNVVEVLHRRMYELGIADKPVNEIPRLVRILERLLGLATCQSDVNMRGFEHGQRHENSRSGHGDPKSCPRQNG